MEDLNKLVSKLRHAINKLFSGFPTLVLQLGGGEHGLCLGDRNLGGGILCLGAYRLQEEPLRLPTGVLEDNLILPPFISMGKYLLFENPNALLFIPVAYHQVEDFSLEWWHLVQASTWFNDYWLRERHKNFAEDADCFSDMLLNVHDLPEKKILCFHCIKWVESDGFVGNALVAMYAKCRSMQNPHQAFDKMYQRDVVMRNALIAGYDQNDDFN
eukprot:Gb_21214 [translate_table: standard]